jgi:predicted branched-subunit amino acid permease
MVATAANAWVMSTSWVANRRTLWKATALGMTIIIVRVYDNLRVLVYSLALAEMLKRTEFAWD